MNQSHTSILMHVFGILTLVLGVAQPVFNVLPPPYGTIALAVAGGLTYAMKLLGYVVPAVPSAPTVKASSTLKMLAWTLPFAGLLLMLVSCSFLQTSAGATVELAAVDSAIAVLESKGVPAATINGVAQLALTGDATATAILSGMLAKANPALTEAEAALAAAAQEAIKDTTPAT
jgi:hypothetical protein